MGTETPGELVVWPVSVNRENRLALAEQLEAWNERGEYCGLQGTFEYSPAAEAIVFLPYL